MKNDIGYLLAGVYFLWRVFQILRLGKSYKLFCKSILITPGYCDDIPSKGELSFEAVLLSIVGVGCLVHFFMG